MARIAIRAATPEAFARPYLANATFTDVAPANVNAVRALSPDRASVYAVNASRLMKSTNDGGTWTVVKDFGAGYGDLTGAWILPNGEMAVSSKLGGSPDAGLTVSSGFPAGDTTATWARTKIGGADLRMSLPDNTIHASWGLSYAPKGHVREGLVCFTEYGGHSTAASPDAQAPKVWLSLDYGRTARTIGDLFTIAGGRVNQHAHGVCYDPWSDQIIACYGDGNGSGAWTGIVVCDNFLDPTPTWRHLYKVNNAAFQPTTMFPTAAGLILGGDGYPPGVYRLPRRGFREWGTLQTVLHHGGGTDTGWIGQAIRQAGPGAPILLCHELTKTYDYPCVINATFNGVDYFELWRDTSKGKSPSANAIGPTLNGKVLVNLTNDGRTANNRTLMVADLVIP